MKGITLALAALFAKGSGATSRGRKSARSSRLLSCGLSFAQQCHVLGRADFASIRTVLGGVGTKYRRAAKDKQEAVLRGILPDDAGGGLHGSGGCSPVVATLRDVARCRSALAVASTMGRHDIVEQYMEALRRGGITPDVECFNTLVHSCGGKGNLGRMEEVLARHGRCEGATECWYVQGHGFSVWSRQ